MNELSFQIEFRAARIEVACGSEALAAPARARFARMIAQEPGAPTSRIEISGEGAAFSLVKDGAAPEAEDSAGKILRLLEARVLDACMAANPDLLWMHGAAAAREGRALLLLGRFGSGKSTLVTNLLALGWKYLSDDIVPVDPPTGRAHAFARTPHIRQGPSRMWSEEKLRNLRKTEMKLEPGQICREGAPLAALLFPRYEEDAGAEFAPCHPAAAARGLIENNLNYASHGKAAVAFIAALARDLPALALRYSDGPAAAAEVARRFENGFRP